jgi:hypothetical protein
MNKDRIDCSGNPIMRESDIHTEATLLFKPLATPDATVSTGTRRVLQLVDGTPFILPAGAVIVTIGVMPYPADRTAVYTGDMLDATRIALGTPTITLTRNTDTTAALQAGDNPIKIFAQTEPAGTPDTMGMVTDKLVITLTRDKIGPGTRFLVHGEEVVKNDWTETDAGAGGMPRTAGDVYPHGANQDASDTVVNSPTCLVGIVGTSAIKYDVAVVIHYRTTRTQYYLTDGTFPLDMRDEPGGIASP